MGNKRFNFDLYVEELLTEALSPAQMQEQIKKVGLDPAKYDQNHLIFLVGLINSNQGIEVYDELLNRIKDKNTLKSILSVSVNDRRSDKPTVDMDKINRALQYANDPNELRSIISGQKREIVKTEEPQYDSSKLREFLSKNGADDLLEILIKIRAEVDNTLESFVTEYIQAEDDVKRYVKTNAHRATDVLKLAGILHEAKSKMLNPFNASTSLTVDDLRKESDFYNLEKNFYIVRTTYPDDPSKSLKLNLKYGQGNRFGLCISSKTQNYYLSYRTDDYLTTHFVYRLADPSLDENDINSYNIAIIDSIGDPNADDYSDVVSYNPVATLTNLDPVEFEYDNTDTKLDNHIYLYRNRLKHIFQEDSLNLTSRDNKNYILNANTFFKIFTPLEISPHEQRLSSMINLDDNEFEDEFFAVSPKDQIVVLINGALDKIDEYSFSKLTPEVRDFFVKNSDTIKDNNLYNQYTEKEKQGYKTRKLNQISKQYESYKKASNEAFYQTDYKDDYKDTFMEIYPSSQVLERIKSNIDINIILENPEYRKTFLEPQIKLANMIRQEILDEVVNGIYKGDLMLNSRKYQDALGRTQTKKRDLKLYLVLPDLSDIIIDGSLHLEDKKLSSLKGCPRIIKNHFNCNSNNLTSLEHGPELVGLSYNANSNSLQTLKGCAKMIGSMLSVKNNKQLKNLEGCPEVVYSFYASNCGLETLKGGPKISSVYEVTNNNLKNLDYGPEYIKEYLRFAGNPIENVEGFPKYFCGFSDAYQLHLDSQKQIKINLGIPEGEAEHKWPITDYLISRLLNHIDYDTRDRAKAIEHDDLVRVNFDKKYQEMSVTLTDMISQAKLDYNNRRSEINRESVIYNLMKSYLLTH